MADTKISALPTATVPLAGTEVLPIVQSSTTKQVSVANLTAGRAISASSITNSALTSGRVTYAGTSGLLQDSANLTYDASGDLLVGTTLNNAYINGTTQAVYRGIFSKANSSTAFDSVIGQLAIDNLNTTANNYSQIAFTTSDGANRVVTAGIYAQITARSSANWTTSNLQFHTGDVGSPPAEKMRIDNVGNLLLGTTNTVIWNTTNTGVAIGGSSAPAIQVSRSGDASLLLNRTSSDGDIAIFARQGSAVGGISVTPTLTSYNVTSDYRLKENIAPMTGALATVAQLKPVTYKWKADGSDGQGFIAHELAEVVPDCVTGEKDATKEEEYEIAPAVKDDMGIIITPAQKGIRTVPVYQGMDASFLIATLTAAIQELKAEFDLYKATHP